MPCPRPVSRLALCSAAAIVLSAGAFSLAGCSPADDTGSGSGGAPGSGGQTATGGSSASGGATSSGGSTSSGGATATGGASASGGATGTGGRSSSGGATATGGSAGGAMGGRTGDGTGGRANGTGGGGGSAGASATGGAGGGSAPAAGKSAGCGKAPTIAANMYNNGTTIPFMVGTEQRRYILSVPTGYDNTKPYKLIIAYHQLDGNDKQMYANGYYHLQPLSGTSTIFIAPNGQTRASPAKPCTGTGNGEGGCGWPDSNGANLAFMDALVAHIEENFCVDTNRIYATGWSYGGSMSYRTACSRPLGGTAAWGVRAVAAYSAAQLSGNCTPSKAVAYYASHGTSDGVLSYDNNMPDGGGVSLAKNFAKVNGCTWMTPTKVTSGNHVCTNEMACMAGYPVRFCSFNGDHTPDPRDGGGGTSWEYMEAWTFLNQF